MLVILIVGFDANPGFHKLRQKLGDDRAMPKFEMSIVMVQRHPSNQVPNANIGRCCEDRSVNSLSTCAIRDPNSIRSSIRGWQSKTERCRKARLISLDQCNHRSLEYDSFVTELAFAIEECLVRLEFHTRHGVWLELRRGGSLGPYESGDDRRYGENANNDQSVQEGPLASRVEGDHNMGRLVNPGQGIGTPELGACERVGPLAWRDLLWSGVLRASLGAPLAPSGSSNCGASGHPHWNAEPVAFLGATQ